MLPYVNDCSIRVGPVAGLDSGWAASQVLLIDDHRGLTNAVHGGV